MTRDQRLKLAKQELESARRALEDAELLSDKDRVESAISRAYYAIFHAARATLYAQGSEPITHRGVKREFGRLIVKTGRVEMEYNAILQEARDQRQVADYESGEKELLPGVELARDIVAKAKKFVNRMSDMVEKEL